jgi:two-component system NtrC family sensor kinase
MYIDMRNATITLFALLIAVGVLFGFFVTYLSTNWILRPLSSLAEGMDRVAKGDLDHKVRTESEDELGRLVKSFNLMVKNIKEREIRLQQISEERFSSVEKQVSIGRLAAGVAHEINNPLTSVLSLSMLMQQAAGPDDPHAEDLAVIVEETTRCRNIVRDLLDFARESPMERRIVDLNQVIQETLALVSRYEAMEGIQTELHLSPVPLLVHGDPKRLQQVFTNMITNAAEACGPDGLIVISTDEDSSGGYVVARIADNGKGIPPELRSRVFEPFFTTKGSGQGTGLGLSVSVGIVREHGGVIDLESEEGAGTTVTIQLPRMIE